MIALFLLSALGLWTIGGGFASLLYTVVWKAMLRGGKNLKKKYGEWAVITGATDGIGKAMAFEHAKRGQNVLLIARSAEKLAACKAEISAKYPKVQVRVEVVDFASFTQKDTKRMTELLSQIEVGVLVNNVGVSYAFPQWFHELTEAEVQSLLTINIESVVWMTRAVLPQMLARKTGAIVNMSSAAAKVGPLLGIYSSTKGFVENFTRSLAIEYASKGIDFQCQMPLWVATAITFPNSKVPMEKRATLWTPTAATYAKYAVARIGYDVMVSPYPAHEFFMWMQARVPDALVGSTILKIHKGARFHKKNVDLMSQKQIAQKKSS